MLNDIGGEVCLRCWRAPSISSSQLSAAVGPRSLSRSGSYSRFPIFALGIQTVLVCVAC